MTNQMHTDFNYIYRDNTQFFPVIHDGGVGSVGSDASNAVVIKLSAKISDDLLWEEQRLQALEIIKNDKLILWELDFGFSDKTLETTHSAEFYSYGIALEEFSQNIWPEFKDKSLGVILYRGDCQFIERFHWTEDHRTYFFETIHEESLHASLQKKIESSDLSWHEALCSDVHFHFYAATMFAQYLQRLASYLPDDTLVFSLFDVSGASSTARLALLLSKERFGHILLGLKNAKVALGHLNWEDGLCLGGWIGRGSAYFSTMSEVRIGICLPEEHMFTEQVEGMLNNIFDELIVRQIPCRVIPEAMLTEAWDGIDYILVISSAVSYQGKRRLQGFCAAGGTVVLTGFSLDLACEMAYADFRKELASQEALI